MYYSDSARICARVINDEEFHNRVNDIAHDYNQYYAAIGSDMCMRVVETTSGLLLEKCHKETAHMDWVNEQLADMRKHGGKLAVSDPERRYTDVKVPTENRFQPYKIYRAYCSPDDRYRQGVGMAVAWARSQGREIPEFI